MAKKQTKGTETRKTNKRANKVEVTMTDEKSQQPKRPKAEPVAPVQAPIQGVPFSPSSVLAVLKEISALLDLGLSYKVEEILWLPEFACRVRWLGNQPDTTMSHLTAVKVNREWLLVWQKTEGLVSAFYSNVLAMMDRLDEKTGLAPKYGDFPAIAAELDSDNEELVVRDGGSYRMTNAAQKYIRLCRKVVEKAAGMPSHDKYDIKRYVRDLYRLDGVYERTCLTDPYWRSYLLNPDFPAFLPLEALFHDFTEKIAEIAREGATPNQVLPNENADEDKELDEKPWGLEDGHQYGAVTVTKVGRSLKWKTGRAAEEYGLPEEMTFAFATSSMWRVFAKVLLANGGEVGLGSEMGDVAAWRDGHPNSNEGWLFRMLAFVQRNKGRAGWTYRLRTIDDEAVHPSGKEKKKLQDEIAAYKKKRHLA